MIYIDKKSTNLIKGNPLVKIFHFFYKYIWVIKWCIGAPGALISMFWKWFWKVKKISKKSQKNLKKFFLEYRSGVQIGIPFFQKAKTMSKRSQIELEKIWGGSLIFSLQPCSRKRYPHRAKFWDTEGSNMTKTEN